QVISKRAISRRSDGIEVWLAIHWNIVKLHRDRARKVAFLDNDVAGSLRLSSQISGARRHADARWLAIGPTGHSENGASRLVQPEVKSTFDSQSGNILTYEADILENHSDDTSRSQSFIKQNRTPYGVDF